MRRLFEHIPRNERRAALVSLFVGVGLLSVKFVAYFITGSAAIFSDALESIANVLGSGVAIYSLVLAHLPADREHPYGHGKIEFVSAAFEGGMILLAAIVIAIKTLDTLIFHQVEIEDVGLGLVLIAAAMVVNGAVGIYLIRTGRRQGSMTLEADGKHLMSDAITSIAALVALGIVQIFKWKYADPIGALLIAAYIGWMGLSLLRKAGAGLMDRQDLADTTRLESLLDAHIGPQGKEPRICSYHKLRHRHSGRYHWVDFHMMIPPDLGIVEAHRIASAIEYEMEQMLGEANATAHVEPCRDEGCDLCESLESEK